MNQRLVAVVCGSIIYRFVLLLVLKAGFNTNDMNLISSLVLALCLMLPTLRKKFRLDRFIKRGVAVPNKERD